MGACTSHAVDLNPSDLRLAAVEYDMKVLQKNFEILHQHMEILTQNVRNEMSIVVQATDELKGCPMGIQQRQHVASLHSSVKKVIEILNPPPCPSSDESTDSDEYVMECCAARVDGIQTE